MRSIICIFLLCFFCHAASALTNAQIKQKLIEHSINAYLSTYAVCPCPYSKDKHGAPCGDNNAWSLDKKYAASHSVYCYPNDVSDRAVQEYRDSQ